MVESESQFESGNSVLKFQNIMILTSAEYIFKI